MISSGKTIMLAHGGGGQLTDDLLRGCILPRLGNDTLNDMLDAGIVDTDASRVALTVDSYVVTPWRFPGGDIGRIAVCGTVNDLAVCGAQPLGLALSLIVSEGFARRDLETVLDSVRHAADEAGVNIITGDTKVIGVGAGDGIYITTAGVGAVPAGRDIRPQAVKGGDVIVINGPIGEHGLAVMLAREMPEVTTVLRTDAAPLNGLVENILATCADVRFMRDATRGGLAGVAADLAEAAGRNVTLDETAIPIRPEARHAADMLGLDPLDIANEGKLVAVVPAADADTVLAVMRSHPYGRNAVAIGRVEDEAGGVCTLRTVIGGRRVVQKPYGEQLPRIC